MPSYFVDTTLAGCAQNQIALREMGSFHVGGREVELSGKPVQEVVFTPGGAPATIDLNGKYLVESMYVQYFLPAERRGAVPLLMWHGGGLTGVTYSHMIMMDKNSNEVAAYIQAWLEKQGLYR